MATIIILAISVLLQLTAAVLALRLIHTTGARLAWLTLSSAIFLMALRRAMTLGTAIVAYPLNQPSLQTESLALFISGLVLFAVIMIKPLFESIRRSEQVIFTEKERMHVTLQAIGDGVVSFDIHGRVQYMNPVAESLCGVSLQDAKGQSYDKILVLVDESSRLLLPDPVNQCLEKSISKKLDDRTLLINQNNHTEHSVEVMASPIKDRSNEIIGTVLVLHDITELKGMARQLSYQASHDSLTGLINRQEFEHRLGKLLEDSRHNNVQHAMCYMDMDDFKIVNDTCGHIAGDEMLKAIAGLLKKQVRETDVLARLGGDEFGILFEACPGDQVQGVVEKLRQAVSEYSFAWQDNVFNTSISIGVVPITSNSVSITDVLSAADSACYVAKERGRNCVHVYTEDDNEISKRHGQMKWVQVIQKALLENQFCLYSQSISTLNQESESKKFYEILLRLIDENGTVIRPTSFIPAAERYYLMPAIDRWVVKHTLSYINQQTVDANGTELYSINLSGQSLGEEEFLDYVLQQFELSNVHFHQVCFEITETAVISNIVCAQNFLETLRNKGCLFALDDFGSGLSSFTYLKTLPVDYLKIDGSFIQNLLSDENDYNLVISINQIGHVMGINTIAEFVEDKATLQALENIGIDYAQGYEIGRPELLQAEGHVLAN
ncbi:MAG: EAL domain-containing protein [Gammaproteobacteria bacterium]|nr:EAL domain-containing protein [Gammaproteobacteria bacterium]